MHPMGELTTPFLSSCQNNLGENTMFWTIQLVPSPSRTANSVPSICNSYLSKMPESYALVSNRKKWPIPWTTGTSYELFPSSPISGRTQTCACQEQSLHMEMAVQHGIFFKTSWRKTKLGGGVCLFVNSSALVIDVYVPIQPSETNHSAARTGGRDTTSSHILPPSKVEHV